MNMGSERPLPWLPIGFAIAPRVFTGGLLHAGPGFQMYAATGDARVTLVAESELAADWLRDGFLKAEDLTSVAFGDMRLSALVGDTKQVDVLSRMPLPQNRQEAEAVATAIRRTLTLRPDARFNSAIYYGAGGFFLPTVTGGPAVAPDVVLGRYLSGGVAISALDRVRIGRLSRWLSAADIDAVVAAAGLAQGKSSPATEKGDFVLVGRRDLEQFFREHVIDIAIHPERYSAFGITFPAGVVLVGPPGCGKTFAVERLIEYLGWPSFSIDSSSVGSPFIHGTGMKIARVFEDAIEAAPSVLVMDEMEAFLATRDGNSDHRVEEVAEFLRRIPQAAAKRVLLIGMTNRPDAIDPAVLRRGRFDHVIEVSMAGREEIADLLQHLLHDKPHDDDLDLASAQSVLAGRPMSDATFLMREAARLAARANKRTIDAESFAQALGALTSRSARAIG